MIFPSREIVDRMKEKYQPGTIVILDRMNDAQAPPVGTPGVVKFVDDTGSIGVNWKNGGTLNVVYGEDMCHIASEKERKNYTEVL